jgi:hypothetical protein
MADPGAMPLLSTVDSLVRQASEDCPARSLPQATNQLVLCNEDVESPDAHFSPTEVND